MQSRTGEIVEVPDAEMKEIEKAFNAQVDKAKKLGAGNDPAQMMPDFVPVLATQIKKVRKMNKERRKAWAKSEFERRVRRKRQRKARKAGRKGKSR